MKSISILVGYAQSMKIQPSDKTQWLVQDQSMYGLDTVTSIQDNAFLQSEGAQIGNDKDFFLGFGGGLKGKSSNHNHVQKPLRQQLLSQNLPDCINIVPQEGKPPSVRTSIGDEIPCNPVPYYPESERHATNN